MTHVNAYKMDVEDAYNKAVNALSEFKSKVDDLQAKHDEDAAAVAEPAPVAEPEPETKEDSKPETKANSSASSVTKSK